jgi:sec-independent protein translocase protein TatC
VEIASKLEGLGRVMDAAQVGLGTSSRTVLRGVMDKRLEALTALQSGQHALANTRLDEAAALLSGVSQTNSEQISALWKLEKALAMGGALLKAQTWTQPMLSMNEQLSLVLVMELALGLIFELPLVMALLAVVGLIKASWLIKYQRHAFVACLIAGAVITPSGDAASLALMAGPMFLCYEVGVIAVWIIEKRRKKEDVPADLEVAP